jgi:hypothetical protein
VPDNDEREPSVLQAEDIINEARYLVYAIRMMCSDMDNGNMSNALDMVATTAGEKLITARDMLEAVRHAKGGDA